MTSGMLALRGFVALGEILELKKVPSCAPSETLDALYRSYWPSLCAHLRRAFGAGPPDPEDAAQAAFTRFAALPDRDQVLSPRAFIWRSAVNYTIDQKRRDRRRYDYACRYGGMETVTEFDYASPEEALIEIERKNLLLATIEHMADKPRTVLTLHCFKGYTYQQVADEMGWSYSDVYRQMVAALEFLSASLKPLR